MKNIQLINPTNNIEDKLQSSSFFLQTDRDEIVKGHCTYIKVPNILQFHPDEDIHYVSTYTMYIDGQNLLYADVENEKNVSVQCRDFEWSFSFKPLCPLRMLVEYTNIATAANTNNNNSSSSSNRNINNNVSKSNSNNNFSISTTTATNTSKIYLMNIPRQSPSLLMELTQLLANRFKIDPQTICNITSHMGNHIELITSNKNIFSHRNAPLEI